MRYTNQSWNDFCESTRKADRLMDQIAAPKRCVNCKTKQARATSLYCSDRCKKQFLSFEESK